MLLFNIINYGLVNLKFLKIKPFFGVHVQIHQSE